MPPDPATTDATNRASSASLSTQLDKEQAARAYRKVMSGEQPTSAEQAALRRYEKQQEEQRRWQYYESIPQKHWRMMSGRQTKVLQEQAERYGIPFGGRTVDLSKVVRALHDFLAANARRLATDDDELLNADVSSPALERYRDERALLARLDRLEREQTLVPRHQVRDGLERIASILRAAGDQLQREHGAGALELLSDALDDAQREIQRLFPTDGGATSSSDATADDAPADDEDANAPEPSP